MYTECPNCHTFFKITSAQLKIANGKVRCGSCDEVFNALGSLMDEVPASALNRTKLEQTDVDTVFSHDSAIEVLESDEQAFSDIDVPGTDDLNEPDGDSSLSGLAGSEIVSEVEQAPSLSDLSEISDISDLSDVSDVAEASAVSNVQSKSKSDKISEVTELDGLSDIELADEDVAVNSNTGDLQGDDALARSNLSDINRDIDNALDGLFDDDFADQASVSADSPSEANDILDDTVLSDIPNLDDSNDLPELDLNDADTSPLLDSDRLQLDLSDEPDSRLDSKSKAAKSNNTADIDDFELGDSLLNSETLDMDESDWAPDDRNNEDSEMYSGDSFILEELDDDADKSQSRGLSKVLWISLIFALIFVLAGQFIYLKRDVLVKYPQMLPILEMECQIISLIMPCEIPERKAPDMVELVERNVVSHPKAENALLITSTIRNNADFVQPYPNMTLTFSDINQKVVARRVFTPEEYLAKDVNIASGMAIGVPIKVILEIVDPGEEAVNFQFDFK